MGNERQYEVLEKIARKLRLEGQLTAYELQQVSGVSQPQMSRYLKLLGANVLRIGRGKKVRYAHAREIPQVGAQVPLFSVNEKGELSQKGILHPIHPKGFYWQSESSGYSRVFDDLPYFLNDLRPSGYLGRLIPRTYSDWGFPEDIRLWSADSIMRYLSHFGVDLVGDQIVGDLAAQKFLEEVQRGIKISKKVNEVGQYEDLARKVETYGIPGSSAGGEHPKFLTRRPFDGTPVIVKFVAKSKSEITQRRIDLLRAEHIAAKTFLTEGLATKTRILSGETYTFLEITRFDRAGAFGRKGIISLFSLDAEFLGSGECWSVVAQKLCNMKIIDAAIVQQIIFQEYFGHFIGNTDMHSGNLSFFFEDEKIKGLTPIYDMLPMKYAPVHEKISSDPINPPTPKPASIAQWEKARELAVCYWQEIQATEGFSSKFCSLAKNNEKSLANRRRHL